MPTTPPEPQEIVVLPLAKVREAFEEVLNRRLGELPAQLPALLTREQLCEQLGISDSNLSKLIKEGMPSIRIGQLRRFVLAEVIEWLRARSASNNDTEAA